MTQKNLHPMFVIIPSALPYCCWEDWTQLKGTLSLSIFSTFLSKTTLVPKPVLKIIGKDANLSAKKIRDYAISKGLRLNEDFIIINEFVENISEHINSASVGIVSSLGF